MNESKTALRSFEDFFREEIAPGLPALEARRKDRRRSAYVRTIGGAFVVVIGSLIAGMLWHAFAGGAMLILGTVAVFIWARRPAQRQRAELYDHIIPPLCRFIGSLEYHRKPGGRFDLKRVRRSGIAGAFTQSSLQDLFLGRYRDTEFRLVEARLRRKRRSDGSSRRTVFFGLLCDVSVPVTFSGVVLLVGDKGTRGDWIAGIMQRSFPDAAPVTLDHPAFAERFRVYSDDAVEARRLLQPGLMQTLLALSDEVRGAVGGDGLNAAFLDDRFLMAIPQDRNLFEIHVLNRSLDHAEDDLRRLAAEFTIPHRLIDNLHGDRKPLVPEA